MGSCSTPSLFRWSRRRSPFLGRLLLFQRRSFLFVLVVVASEVGCYNGVGVLFLRRRFVCVSKSNLSPRRFDGFVLKFILCSMIFWKIWFRFGSSQFRSGSGILKSLLALSRWLGSVQCCWGRCRVLIVPLVCFSGLARSALYCSSKIIDMLRNRSSRLEMVMHLLSVVAANGGCRSYRVGGARGAQTHWWPSLDLVSIRFELLSIGFG